MKRIAFLTVIIFAVLVSYATADKRIYYKTGITGGTSVDLDGIDGSTIPAEGGMAFVVDDDMMYFYDLNTSSSASESVPDVISPDSNPGTLRWELKRSGDLYNKTEVDALLALRALLSHTHDPVDINEDSSDRFISDAEAATWDAKSELALGATSATAYRGDRGTTAYAHTSLTNDPHDVTPTQIGLGNVDNTSDATKNAASVTLTNKTIINPAGMDKNDVGLNNVDNTSDATKNAASVTLTNKTITNPAGMDKNDVGLSNVLNVAQKDWVSKWTGDSSTVTNSWGTGQYLINIGDDSVERHSFFINYVSESHHTRGNQAAITDRTNYMYARAFGGAFAVIQAGTWTGYTIRSVYRFE